MADSPFNLEYQSRSTEGRIIAGLDKIGQAFRVLLWHEGKDLSLSPLQIQILIFLFNHSREYRKVSYLALEFGITKATVSDAVKSLMDKHLILKDYDSADTRTFTLNLTREGKHVTERISGFSRELQVPVEKLSEQQKEILLSTLMTMIKHLNEVGIITTQRMCFSCQHYRSNHQGHMHYCGLVDAPLASMQLP